MAHSKTATINDLNLLNELLSLSKAYWGYDKVFMEKFMDELSVKSHHIDSELTKLCYENDKLVGFYTFVFNDDHALELENFFLHPDYIGKGLGRELWDICCKNAQELGQNEFIIWADPYAENFYIKMGCEKIGVRKSSMMPNRYPPVLKFTIVKKDKGI